MTVIILAAWMPETKGKSLEDIQQSFPQSGRTREVDHVSAPHERRSTHQTELAEGIRAS